MNLKERHQTGQVSGRQIWVQIPIIVGLMTAGRALAAAAELRWMMDVWWTQRYETCISHHSLRSVSTSGDVLCQTLASCRKLFSDSLRYSLLSGPTDRKFAGKRSTWRDSLEDWPRSLWQHCQKKQFSDSWSDGDKWQYTLKLFENDLILHVLCLLPVFWEGKAPRILGPALGLIKRSQRAIMWRKFHGDRPTKLRDLALKNEIWLNAHEKRNAGCLGLSSVTSTTIHSLIVHKVARH